MIWLYAHPLYKLGRRHTGRQRKRDNLLTGDGGEEVGEEPKHTTAIKPGPLKIIQYSGSESLDLSFCKTSKLRNFFGANIFLRILDF